MYNLKTLLKYEYKKVFKRRIVWITLGILMVVCVFMSLSSLLSSSYSNGSAYSKNMEDKENGLDMSGKKIDNELLQSIENTGSKMPNGLYSFMYVLFDNSTDIENLTEKKVYTARRELLLREQKDNYLTDGEIQYMDEQEEQVSKPLTYQYCEGFKKMIAMFYTLGMMQTLYIAICIPGIFADEHNHKMDQLNLSCSQGKKTLFLAKTIVGITLALGATIILALSAAIPNFYIYGMSGFSAQIQLIYPKCSWALTVGQTFLILSALSVVIAILHATIAMILTEKLRNGMAAMAIMVGFMLLTSAFSIPAQYSLLSKIWNCVPNNITAIWGVLDSRMFHLFGTYFTQWQVTLVGYVIISAVAIMDGYRTYHRYQVTN